ncbi:MAG TPA: hypothetical protein VG713_13765 [Pirellulales bacterium]|nr:hypothetical protein [Pirellulales bacterium]
METPEETPEAHEADVVNQLSSIATAREQAEQMLRTAKEAVANLEAEFQTAKRTIAEVQDLLANSKSASEQTLELKAKADSATQAIQGLAVSANENASRVEAIRESADQSQALIVTKSEYIEGGRAHAERVQAELDRLASEAKQSATNAEAQNQSSRSSLDNLNATYNSALAVKAALDANAAAVESALLQCNQNAEITQRLAAIAQETEERVKSYEARLVEFEKSANERMRIIEGLLPGAASAGLASAFNKRREHFKLPQRLWQTVFVACMLSLVALAALEFNFFSHDATSLSWEQLVLSIMHRLPFAVPIIWLAVHASHKAALAQRVEEDYAFKETVSRSFEGYRREMAELEGKAAPESALSRLCEGVLSVITSAPGRIYEKHPLNHTPMNVIAENAVPLADAISRATKAQLTLEMKS